MEEKSIGTSNKVSKIKERVGFAVDILLISLAVAIMISTAINGRINLFGYSVGTVMSGSMLPEYKVFSLIVVDSDKRPKVGQVGVYEKNGRKIVHRVKEIRDSGYIFKGDNNKDEDPYIVKEEQIVGKVVYHTDTFAPVLETLGEGKLNMIYTILVVCIMVQCLIDIVSRCKKDRTDNNGK